MTNERLNNLKKCATPHLFENNAKQKQKTKKEPLNTSLATFLGALVLIGGLFFLHKYSSTLLLHCRTYVIVTFFELLFAFR